MVIVVYRAINIDHAAKVRLRVIVLMPVHSGIPQFVESGGDLPAHRSIRSFFNWKGFLQSRNGLVESLLVDEGAPQYGQIVRHLRMIPAVVGSVDFGCLPLELLSFAV